VVVVFRSLKEWTKPKAAAPVQSAAQAQKDDYVSRFEEELKKQK
jgi:hypothetical protein